TPRRARRLSCLLLLAMSACGGGGGSGDSTTAGAATLSARDAAKRVDSYLICYGPWDDAKIQVARTHPLVIVHPTNANVTRQQIAAIQEGSDGQRTLVLGYISIGEDL